MATAQIQWSYPRYQQRAFTWTDAWETYPWAVQDGTNTRGGDSANPALRVRQPLSRRMLTGQRSR